MARGVRGTIEVRIKFEEFDDSGAAAGSETKRLLHQMNWKQEFDPGTTDGTQLDRIWSTSNTLTTTPTDLDLVSTSSLPSAMDSGLNVSMSDLAVICVMNDSASGSGDVDVGGGTGPVTGWTLADGDGVSVRPQGLFLYVAPYGVGVTPATADILRFAASTGSVDARVLVAGRTV